VRAYLTQQEGQNNHFAAIFDDGEDVVQRRMTEEAVNAVQDHPEDR
jgi:hypothetical protein